MELKNKNLFRHIDDMTKEELKEIIKLYQGLISRAMELLKKYQDITQN